jgi:hypothetical protein
VFGDRGRGDFDVPDLGLDVELAERLIKQEVADLTLERVLIAVVAGHVEDNTNLATVRFEGSEDVGSGHGDTAHLDGNDGPATGTEGSDGPAGNE